MSWYLQVLKKYAVFSGRARRKEYWVFVLINVLVATVLAALDIAVGTEGLLPSIYSLAVLLPSLGVTVRRLHDTGRSGWWLLILAVPVIGAIVLFVFLVADSHKEGNSFGLSPKYA